MKISATNGEYGDIIKTIIEADTHGELHFSCEEDIFQCIDCRAIVVAREKEIRNCYNSANKYDLKIAIKQNCPKCNSKYFEKINKLSPMCPKCKDGYLELVRQGNWD